MPWAKELLKLNEGKSDLQSAIEVRELLRTGCFHVHRVLRVSCFTAT